MKFHEVSKDTQLVLLGGAMAGVIEVFTRDEDDVGRQVLEAALKQVGLTPDEFQVLMTEMEPEVEKELNAVLNRANDEADEDVDSDLDTMEERPGNLYDNTNADADGWENLQDA